MVSILTSSVHTKNGFIPNPMPQFSQITQAGYRYIPTFFLSIKPLASLRFVVKVLKKNVHTFSDEIENEKVVFMALDRKN